ncbi:MAG TPA: glycosidase, partial [Candidatus Bathyarchaeia archaeon]|nr:glycosidase [Candidatus Bathyarchaeia archaeon]
KIGIAGPPHKTKEGWVLIYHGLSAYDDKYRLSAVLLDLHSPDKVLSRLDYPILEPEEIYENEGLRAKTVFSCGSVVKKGQLLVYYGAGDKVLAVASVPFKKLIEVLKKS